VSARTRQSGTGRTSPVRETQLENAQMRPDDDDGVRASARTPLPIAGSWFEYRRETDVRARVRGIKGSRTNQKVLTVNFFRCLCHRILGIFSPDAAPHTVVAKWLIDRKKSCLLLHELMLKKIFIGNSDFTAHCISILLNVH